MPRRSASQSMVSYKRGCEFEGRVPVSLHPSYAFVLLTLKPSRRLPQQSSVQAQHKAAKPHVLLSTPHSKAE